MKMETEFLFDGAVGKLFLDDAKIHELKMRVDKEPLVRQLVERELEYGHRIFTQPALQYDIVSGRLMHVSRAFLRGVMSLGFCYRWTGDSVYLAKLEVDMRTVAAFPDWGERHFLDVGEMAAGMAIALNWFSEELSTVTISTCSTALFEKAICCGYLGILDGLPSWVNMRNNWEQVCFGGLAVAAVVLWDQHRTECQKIIETTLERFSQHIERNYAPDGVYPEGVSYWLYGSVYMMMASDAISMLSDGKCAPSEDKAVLASLDFVNAMIGPLGEPYNYQDSFDMDLLPAMFWLISRRDGSGDAMHVADWINKQHATDNFQQHYSVFSLGWLPSKERLEATKEPSTLYVGQGENGVATLRGDDLWLAAKGGSPSAPHGHFDAGSFILEAQGKRWFVDTGCERYEHLEAHKLDLWNYSQDSERWSILRLNHLSHSIPLIDDKAPAVAGRAELQINEVAGHSFSFDLSDLYKENASLVTRTMSLLENVPGIEMIDHFEGVKIGSKVTWNGIVSAEKIIVKGKSACLYDGDKVLEIKVIDPDVVHFLALPLDAYRTDIDSLNPDIYRISISSKVTDRQQHHLRLQIKLS